MPRRKSHDREQEQTPEASFPSLVLTLAAGALQHMGLVTNPITKKKEKNMLLAKHTIDMLVMLKKKTKGNLQDEEENLLDELLHDLRVKFVKAKGRGEDVEESNGEEPVEGTGSERREAGS